MQITGIKIRKITDEGKMKAIVSVTFDDAFVVHDIKVIESQGKVFVAMPSRKTPEGEFKDIAHPINVEMRNILHQAIIDKYQEEVALYAAEAAQRSIEVAQDSEAEQE